MTSTPASIAPRTLGTTGLTVSGVCVGTSPLGNMPKTYGYEVGEKAALDTLREVFKSPLTFVDTSNQYGEGESERLIGEALREAGGLPAGFVLATKIDPAPGQKDFSGARARASVAESRERLGLDTLELVYLHDAERIDFDYAMGPGGPVEALEELKAQGVVRHIGVASGPVDLERRYVDTGRFEVVLTHNRWSLLDRSGDPLLAEAAAAGVAVVNAAPFGGGILVKGPDEMSTYGYRPASEPVLEAARAMERACAARGVPLAAAALQFSTRDPRVVSTVVGFTQPSRVQATVELAATEIPEGLWEELDALVPPPEHWLY